MNSMKRATRSTVIFAASAFPLAGCTHLEVYKSTGSDLPSRSGYAYMLDYTQYDVVLTRTLASCKAGEKPKLKIEATPTASLAPDGEQVYVINPQSLISAFKTTEVSAEYKDGRLIGFNTTTEDKTGEVIASVAKTAGKIATMAAGIPLPVAGDGTGISACTADAENKLAFIKDNKDKLTDLTAALQKVSDELVMMTNQFSVTPTNALRKQILAKKDAVEKTQKANDALAKSIGEANDWLKDTITVTWPESSTVGSSGVVHPLRPAVMQKWFDLYRPFEAKYAPIFKPGGRRLENDGPAGNIALLAITPAQFASDYPELLKPAFDPTNCGALSVAACEQYKAFRRKLVDEKEVVPVRTAVEAAVSFYLIRRGSYGLAVPRPQVPPAAPKPPPPTVPQSPRAPLPPPPQKEAGPEREGIRYRVPAAGYLIICEHDQNCVNGGEKPVSKTAGAIAQLGLVFNVPFSSPIFASGNISLTFDEQGRLAKAGLKRTNSAALAAANVAGSVADAAAAYLKASDGKELAEVNEEVAIAKAKKDLYDAELAVTKTPTQQLNEELALLEAQQKLAAARAGLPSSELKVDLTNQIAIAKLDVELAEQRKKLEEDPEADQDAVRSQYNAVTAVFEAQKESLEAEAAAIQAQRELNKIRAGPS